MDTPADPLEEVPEADSESIESEKLPELHNLNEPVPAPNPPALEEPAVREDFEPEPARNEIPSTARRGLWFGMIVSLLLMVSVIGNALLLAHIHGLQARVDQLNHALSLERPSTDLRILSATYGSGGSFADVTAHANDLLRQPETIFYAHPDWLGADPTPGWNKQLIIIYEYKGQRRLFTTGEGGEASAARLRGD